MTQTKHYTPTVTMMRQGMAATIVATKPDQSSTQPPWQLVLAHQKIILNIARKFSTYEVPAEDLIQVGLIAAHRAAQTWDPARGPLDARIGKLAMQDIWAYIQQERKSIPPTSLDEPLLNKQDDDEQTLANRLEDETSEYFQELFQTHELITQLLSILSPEERLIIQLRFGFSSDGQTYDYSDIWRRTGRDRATIKRIETRAMGRMQSYVKRMHLSFD
jgi:RNA polymerase sigma factor (sigma-70 family)